jgi:transposase InsO family protein
VLRLTREAGLLAPTAQVRKRAARLHDGTITVTIPDTLWATDATEGWSAEGRSAVFAIIDHASGEVWTDASLRMDRWAAADLLREVTTERFGSVEQAVAAGLALRYDGGPCFRSEHYQAEIDHLGIARSPAYHYEPETNGCIERFMGVLKEQVLWIERFDTHEALRARVREFARIYNRSWLLERHGYRTPIEAREHLAPSGARGMITTFTTEVSGEPGPGHLRLPRTLPDQVTGLVNDVRVAARRPRAPRPRAASGAQQRRVTT